MTQRVVLYAREEQGRVIIDALTEEDARQLQKAAQASCVTMEEARKSFQSLAQAIIAVEKKHPQLSEALRQRLTWRSTWWYRLRRCMGLACLSVFLLTGCAGNQGGLFGLGIYKTSMGGPMARVGMTQQQVVDVMGYSTDTYLAGRGELWRYSYNLLGWVGPSCSSSSGIIGCIDVYFYEGQVSNVITY